MQDSTIKNLLIKLAPFVFFIFVWKLAAVLVSSEIILPTPEKTLASLCALLQTRGFWSNITVTITRGLAGFLLSLAVGLVVGLVIGLNKTANILLQPLIILCRSTPLMSIILITLIWLKTEHVPIFVSFLISFPIICGNVTEGIKNVDSKLVEMAFTYKVKKIRVLNEVYLPSLVPYLLAGISNAMGIGWKVVIAAEVLSHPRFGIGTRLQYEKINLETASVFAWTIVALIISFAFENFIRVVEKKVLSWR
ncbi:MAG: ABC transporter permease [Dethiobacter sp.]|jgi:NitT/TauT family transport system permease protein|nr:ABC transporter permease [Dethiobacter sp.]